MNEGNGLQFDYPCVWRFGAVRVRKERKGVKKARLVCKVESGDNDRERLAENIK